MDHDEIHVRMESHDMSALAQSHSIYVRHTLIDTAKKLIGVVPPGREQSLMMTALEEALMWANKGIAIEGCTLTDQIGHKLKDAHGHA